MARIAKKGIIANYLMFVAGIQISACVNLLTNIYVTDLPLQRFVFAVLSGLSLGVTSFLSVMLASEVEHVSKFGELAIGTLFESEKEKDNLMNKELEKTVSLMFLGQSKRIDKIKLLICSDISLTIIGLAVALAGKLTSF